MFVKRIALCRSIARRRIADGLGAGLPAAGAGRCKSLLHRAAERRAVISGPVVVKMGLGGMGVAPAGVEKKDTGHHHILVNQKLADDKAPLPADDKHRHFGGGQTETTLTLPAGTHTLQLVLGDHNHIPHNPMIASEVITITVK